jgi:hypothetical protein
VKALKMKPVDILVATPGRLLHYLKQGEAGLDKPEQAVSADGTRQTLPRALIVWTWSWS